MAVPPQEDPTSPAERRRAEREAQWRTFGDGIRALDDDALLDRVAATSYNFPQADAATAELQRRTTDRIVQSVDRFSEESRKHSMWMFWLTVIIAVLTGVLLLQGFGYLPLGGATSLTPDSNGERVNEVDGVWDEHAGGRR